MRGGSKIVCSVWPFRECQHVEDLKLVGDLLQCGGTVRSQRMTSPRFFTCDAVCVSLVGLLQLRGLTSN